MMIIPLSKNFSWRRPPIITITLVLLNVLAFVLFQGQDSRDRMMALEYYVESGLAQLEGQLYELYLEEQGLPTPEPDPTINVNENDLEAVEMFRHLRYYPEIRGNAHFRTRITEGALLPDKDRRIQRWHELYPEYEARLEQVTSYHYGFKPAYPRPVTWLTCMFLHGGWGHLLGNMIFLWVIGCMIEYGCRYVTFPFIYLLGGLSASGLFWLLNSNSGIPLVGASGAISGIMGAFTVLYGFKKVRLFLNLGFYFNNLVFPAIFILPVWMLKELYGMVYNSGSSTAFAAHLGGLIGGALLALIFRYTPGFLEMSSFAPADEDEEKDKSAPLLEQALAHMGKLEYPHARALLVQIIAEDPQRVDAWQHLFTIDRQNPEAAEFHRTTANLLDLLGRQPADYPKAVRIFEDYLKFAKPPRLSLNHYLSMAQIFMAMGDLKQAQRLIMALLKKAPQLPALPAAIYKLAQGLKQNGQRELALRCVRLLQHHYPDSRTTQIAITQLK